MLPPSMPSSDAGTPDDAAPNQKCTPGARAEWAASVTVRTRMTTESIRTRARSWRRQHNKDGQVAPQAYANDVEPAYTRRGLRVTTVSRSGSILSHCAIDVGWSYRARCRACCRCSVLHGTVAKPLMQKGSLYTSTARRRSLTRRYSHQCHSRYTVLRGSWRDTLAHAECGDV
jgi:uncharacterized membrane protein